MQNQRRYGYNRRSVEFYNKSMKSRLCGNVIKMYSMHNKGKFVIAARFIRTLKNKIYYHVTAVSKNVYINKLDERVNKYNNTCNRTTKMKPDDLQPGMYIDCGVKHSKKILSSTLVVV